jgi:rhamnosyltransferase
VANSRPDETLRPCPLRDVLNRGFASRLTSLTAVIVTWNPPTTMTTELLMPLISSGLSVVVVDNCSIASIHYPNSDGLVLLKSSENLGLSTPLSNLLRPLRDAGVEWLWYFDQDTRIDTGVVDAMVLATENDRSLRVGQFAAQYIDRNSGITGYSESRIHRSPFTPIGSGSAFLVAACLDLGGFETRLPLDLWDFEISLRLQSNRYAVTMAPDVKISHTVGVRTRHRLLGLTMMEEGHDPWRYQLKCQASRIVVGRYLRRYPQWCSRHLAARLMGIAAALLTRRDRPQIFKHIILGTFRDRRSTLPGEV